MQLIVLCENNYLIFKEIYVYEFSFLKSSCENCVISCWVLCPYVHLYTHGCKT